MTRAEVCPCPPSPLPSIPGLQGQEANITWAPEKEPGVPELAASACAPVNEPLLPVKAAAWASEIEAV